ncbi:hypothetical protein D9758_000930 [Tetrapyrgos nigripes]|uniref:Uncharacterized protein n=1 Tax=Tetrapyrgos nigripes TaxID=182062 RepID=A0A8H5GZD8_9AGAR|nr:hypothetical protein D9758_000930 [Tetrapyrgos nigripes]
MNSGIVANNSQSHEASWPFHPQHTVSSSPSSPAQHFLTQPELCEIHNVRDDQIPIAKENRAPDQPNGTHAHYPTSSTSPTAMGWPPSQQQPHPVLQDWNLVDTHGYSGWPSGSMIPLPPTAIATLNRIPAQHTNPDRKSQNTITETRALAPAAASVPPSNPYLTTPSASNLSVSSGLNATPNSKKSSPLIWTTPDGWIHNKTTGSSNIVWNRTGRVLRFEDADESYNGKKVEGGKQQSDAEEMRKGKGKGKRGQQVGQTAKKIVRNEVIDLTNSDEEVVFVKQGPSSWTLQPQPISRPQPPQAAANQSGPCAQPLDKRKAEETGRSDDAGGLTAKKVALNRQIPDSTSPSLQQGASAPTNYGMVNASPFQFQFQFQFQLRAPASHPVPAPRTMLPRPPVMRTDPYHNVSVSVAPGPQVFRPNAMVNPYPYPWANPNALRGAQTLRSSNAGSTTMPNSGVNQYPNLSSARVPSAYPAILTPFVIEDIPSPGFSQEDIEAYKLPTPQEREKASRRYVYSIASALDEPRPRSSLTATARTTVISTPNSSVATPESDTTVVPEREITIVRYNFPTPQEREQAYQRYVPSIPRALQGLSTDTGPSLIATTQTAVSSTANSSASTPESDTTVVETENVSINVNPGPGNVTRRDRDCQEMKASSPAHAYDNHLDTTNTTDAHDTRSSATYATAHDHTQTPFRLQPQFSTNDNARSNVTSENAIYNLPLPARPIRGPLLHIGTSANSNSDSPFNLVSGSIPDDDDDDDVDSLFDEV